MADDQQVMEDDAALEADLDEAELLALAEEDHDQVNWSAWSNLWQFPSILVSLILIGSGIIVATRPADQQDFGGALEQIDEFIAEGQLDLAAQQLNDVVKPYLADAATLHRALYHRALADWLYLSQQRRGVSNPADHQQIDRQYARAEQLGAELDFDRRARWAHTLISLSDMTRARERLTDLDGLLGRTDATEGMLKERNEILRRLVEHSLRQPDLSPNALLQLLGRYRADQMLDPTDILWAVARQAEIRLEAGQTLEAIERLLVDMRRLESMAAGGEGHINFGELYTLLGRAYFEQGRYDYATFNLEQATARLPDADAVKGDALVLLGRIAKAHERFDEAFEHFDRVVRDYAATASNLPGLLGRAEVHSVMGDHEASLADYERLRVELPLHGPRRDIGPMIVSQSLADRHDASLATGQLDRAMDYILVASRFFDAGKVPENVLFRIASTSRQLADNLLAQDTTDENGERIRLIDVDPGVRNEANIHYKRAGEYYLRHARALTVSADDEQWADSLWMSADSYDAGGWHDKAIANFDEYVRSRTSEDPRYPEALFRLAQAYDANLDRQSAASLYDRLLQEHPKSIFAYQSYVPLARDQMSLGNQQEAESLLHTLLSGSTGVTPDAVEYRDAQIELGTLYYRTGDYSRAIVELDKARQRYPDDPAMLEIMFLLADSYRNKAREISDFLEDPLTPTHEQERQNQDRVAYLQNAMTYFGNVITGYVNENPYRLSAMEQDRLRYAYLYRADSAYDLSDYEQAIELYDQAAREYASHHSSLNALVQIVNCYYHLQDRKRAQTASERVKVRLRQLPDDAFDAEDAPMDRDAWEEWLQNNPVMNSIQPRIG